VISDSTGFRKGELEGVLPRDTDSEGDAADDRF
jgi:hypothetical protein